MKFIKNNLYLIAIIALAAAIRLWGLNVVDLQGDGALYAFRAVGWFDFLGGAEQTSPIIWFGEIPWWALLSFHDHPPLVMFVQHIFFKVFGVNTFIALLPFAISGVISVIFLYAIAKLKSDRSQALLTALLMAISSYAVWASRVGYLEGVQTLFITLSVLFFTLFIVKKEYKYLAYWVLCVGLAISSKYSAIFLIPAALIYLLIWKRDVFRNKKFWLSFIIMLVVLSPVIFYNIMVFKTRGHLDAAASVIIGNQPADYSIISGHTVNTNLITNIGKNIKVLYSISSLPIFVLSILSVIYSFLIVIKKRANRLIRYVSINVLVLFIMLIFIGGSPRWSTATIPFLSILNASFIYVIWKKIREKKIFKLGFIILMILVFMFEIFYSINTNVLVKPVGTKSFTYSDSRFYNRGFHSLDMYLKENFFGDLPKQNKIRKLTDAQQDEWWNKGKVLLIDENSDWFSRAWYVYIYYYYYDQPVIYYSKLSDGMAAGGYTDIFEYFSDLGVNEFVFTFVNQDIVDTSKNPSYAQSIAQIEDILVKSGLKPVAEIEDYKGDIIFRVYQFTLND